MLDPFRAAGRYAWLYGRFFRQHLLSMLEYQSNFVIMLIAGLLLHAPGLVFLYTIATRVPAIQGWSINEILVMYALMFLTEGLCSTFVEGFWQITFLIHRGEFDRMLVRPIPALVQVWCQNVGMHGFGMIIVGTALLISSLSYGISWSASKVALVILFVICGFLIRASLILISNTTGFWVAGMGISIAVAVNDLSDFAKYPLTIYNGVIQVLITWILPFAFVGFVPAAILFERPEAAWYLGVVPVVTLICCLAAWGIFQAGLRQYEGVGH